jgi:hypothetical protein
LWGWAYRVYVCGAGGLSCSKSVARFCSPPALFERLRGAGPGRRRVIPAMSSRWRVLPLSGVSAGDARG